VTKVMAKAKLS